MAGSGTVCPAPLLLQHLCVSLHKSPAVKSLLLEKSPNPQTDPANRIKENSVCLYVAACTRQTHAASQSTVPLTAYEDDIYKFYKKKMKGKTNCIIKLCVTN